MEEPKGDTLQGQSAALVKECHSLLSYLRTNMIGEQPEPTKERPGLANPIDNSIADIQEARKVIEETRVILASSVMEKLR